MVKTRRGKWAIAAVLPALAIAVAAMQPKTAGPRSVSPFHQVTFEEDASSPALSPDGKWIAYCVSAGQPARRNLWIRDADSTSAARRLTEGPWNDYDAAFSPDGAFVYFTSDREPQGIYRLPQSGGAAELVRAGSVTPRFS